MAIVQETRCDMCGEVLVGTKGRVRISRSYIEFQGFMRDWTAEPGSTWRNQTYISSPDKRQMAFCTETPDGEARTCFWDYVLMRRESNRVQHEARLREEASMDWEIRNASGSTGPTGSWKPEGGNGYGGNGSGYRKMGSPPPAAPPIS